jgi:hypothetical protein
VALVSAALGSVGGSLVYGVCLLAFDRPQTVAPAESLAFVLGLALILAPGALLIALPILLLVTAPMLPVYRAFSRGHPVLAPGTCVAVAMVIGSLVARLLSRSSFTPPTAVGATFGAAIGAAWAWMARPAPEPSSEGGKR